jgi:hypothetical protein
MDRVEKAISKVLAPIAKLQGFDLKPEWGGFIRYQPYGHDALLIINQGTARGPFFEIKCIPEIRHNKIEIPWNTFGFIYGEDAQKQNGTLAYYRPRGNLPMLKITPATMKEDVVRVAKEIETVFIEKAIPFYKRFADLKEVEALMNKVPLVDIYPYGAGGSAEAQAIRALLLAKAVNPSRYAAVREAFLISDKKTMLPRDKCLQMLEQVDEMVL